MKAFLSVFLPGGTLVLAAGGALLLLEARSSREAVRGDLLRIRKAVEGVHRERLEQLQRTGEPFGGVRFLAMIRSAVVSRNAELLHGRLSEEFAALRIRPAFYAVYDAEGKALLRRSVIHACGASCRHGFPAALREHRHALVDIDGRPFLVLSVPQDNPPVAFLLLGTPLEADLARLSSYLDVEIALLDRGRLLFSSRADWKPTERRDEEVHVAGERFEALSGELDGLDLVLLGSLRAAQRRRREILLVGGAAFGIMIAAALAIGGFLSRILVPAAPGRQAIPSPPEPTRIDTGSTGDRIGASILYVDLRGIDMALLGTEPSEAIVLLNRLVRPIEKGLETDGGRLTSSSADRISALFEGKDHVARAVRAAGELQSRMRAEEVRPAVAVHTGSVLVGLAGNRRIAVGDADRIAERLSGRAAPGQTLVSQDAYRHIADQFRFRELPSLALPDRNDPLRIYEVEG